MSDILEDLANLGNLGRDLLSGKKTLDEVLDGDDGVTTTADGAPKRPARVLSIVKNADGTTTPIKAAEGAFGEAPTEPAPAPDGGSK